MINKVIMVVDDESEMLHMLHLALESQGYLVMRVEDPMRALHITQSLTPNLFILDILMPEMDGYELCRRLRQQANTARTPVIMYSVLDSPQSRSKAFDMGATDYLHKQQTVTALIAKVNTLISMSNGSNGSGSGLLPHM